MLAWLDILSKTLEFVAQKLLGKRIDLSLDQKQKACRGFLEFYDLLFDLEDLAIEFAHLIDPSTHQDRPRRYSYRFAELADRAKALSDDFARKAEGLAVGISIYDPALFRAIGQIMHSKWSWGLGLSRALSPSGNWFDVIRREDSPLPPENRQIERINFKALEQEGESLDLEWTYEEGQRRLLGGEKIDPRMSWNDILAEVVTPLITFKSITIEDLEARDYLASDILEHLRLLNKAREGLALFIRDNFNIDDVLASAQRKSARGVSGGRLGFF
jgi:hypothetical protein